MIRTSRDLVTLLCKRCGTALAPAFNGRPKCPRLSACGYGGIVEDARVARSLRHVRLSPWMVPAELPPAAKS